MSIRFQRDLSNLENRLRINKITTKEHEIFSISKLPPLENLSRHSAFTMNNETGKGSNPNYEEYLKRMEKTEKVTEYASIVNVLNKERLSKVKRPQTFENNRDFDKIESKRDKALSFAKNIQKPKGHIKLDKIDKERPQTENQNRVLDLLERRHLEFKNEVLKIKQSML